MKNKAPARLRKKHYFGRGALKKIDLNKKSLCKINNKKNYV